MPAVHTTTRPSLQFWVLAVFLTVLFMTGGASRSDVQSLVILRPLSIIAVAFACMTLRREHVAERIWLLGWTAAIFALALLHLIPLPPFIWQSLPGRQDLVEIEKLTGLSNIWRPWTLTPMNGWHALLSLFTPLAVILLGVQLSRDDLFRILPLVIGLSTLSGLLGLLQVIGDPQGILYLYRITNDGSAVGLFANRNHAATLLACLFPMLSVYASTARGMADSVRLRQLIAAVIAIVLVPLILVTGSRSGLIAGVIGIGAAALLYQRPINVREVRKGTSTRLKTLPILGSVGVISLVFLTYFFSRAEAIERLFAAAAGEDSRGNFWTVSIDLFWKYFPWGSGSGSFVEAYQIIEPNALLSPYYLNRAHNDWIETAVTFGLPGLVTLLLALVAFGIGSFRLWRKADRTKRMVAYGRLASVMILLIAFASASDYPLRTPTMMGFFAVCALWFTAASRGKSAASAVSGRNH